MIYVHNLINPLTIHAVKTCSFDENAVLLKRIKARNVLRGEGMEVVMQESRVFFPAFLKLLQPIEKSLAWLPLGAQHFAVGKRL
jgi:hypothetical protein